MNLDAVLIVGIIAFGVYSLFALFVHRKERLKIIDKMDLSRPTDSDVKVNMNIWSGDKKFTALRAGLLLAGMGLGLLVAFLIILVNFEKIMRMGSTQTSTLIYTAAVLFFGGLGLLVAYLIERKHDAGK